MNHMHDISGKESGVVLVAVICFTAVAAILAIGLMNESATQLRSAGKTVNFEKAFYVAEGGAERAVAYLRKGDAMAWQRTLERAQALEDAREKRRGIRLAGAGPG